MQNKQVYFHYADARPAFPNKKLLRVFIPRIFKKEGKKLESLAFVFCSDAYLLEINKQFLDHDYYTDIISFDLSEPKSGFISGEIYISSERVRENAREMGLSFGEEMTRVLFHGALHLCGYRDKKKSEIAQMRAKEDEFLKLFAKYIV
ncbi:MAG: rRNA maturation RNase YbeY [Chitinophagaceae bacterium]|nr:rRNA maturation RNase YbeY [Chitinophagaceae bacterium]